MTEIDIALVKNQARLIARRGLLAALAHATIYNPQWWAEREAEQLAEAAHVQSGNTADPDNDRGILPRFASDGV